MEPVEANKFVMFRTWWSIEADSNSMVNKIPDTFSSMVFGVEVIKFHVLFCVHHVKYFTKINLMESSDEDVYRPGLGCYPVFQDYFYFRLIILI